MVHLLHPHPPPILFCRCQMVQVRPKLCPERTLSSGLIIDTDSTDIPSYPAYPRSSRVSSNSQRGTARPQTYLLDLAASHPAGRALSCLEAYSPLHVRDSLWSSNLAATVDKPQLVPPPPHSSQDTRKGIASVTDAANASLTSASSLPP